MYKIEVNVEEAKRCEELFDVNNGECLCSYHHQEKHDKI